MSDARTVDDLRDVIGARLREARALVHECRKLTGGTRELSIVATKIDEASLWLLWDEGGPR